MSSKKEILIITLLTLSIIDVGLYAVGPLFLNSKKYVSPPRVQQDSAGAFLMEPIQPLPLQVAVNTQAAMLGKKLFHDPRLSDDNTVACATCHNLSTAGVDGKRFSTGIKGNVGKLNTPTVFNSGFNLFQFWDGRAASLEEQMDGPVTNPHEMGAGWPKVIAKLEKDPELAAQFKQTFSDGLTAENIKFSIAEFERTLVTPHSRFDKYLRGDPAAITAEEAKGYALFKLYGCATCHQGVAVGGNMFERLGSVRKYFEDHPARGPEDDGRFNVTHDPTHHHYFKVPSLRNVEKTAPYFHNGSVNTLEEAVSVMSYYNLGVKMPEEDVKLIAKFLRTLTGEYEGKPL